MNRSSAMRRWALSAMLFGAMAVTFLLPAYGQQEVDPTWYNPWAAQNPMVAHSAQPQAASHRHPAALKRVSTTQVIRKSHGKQPTTSEVTMARLTK
jgi:hypothetical protein